MTAYQKDLELTYRFQGRGISIPPEVANALRRAEATLHRWAEAECGDSNNYASFSIERDETTDKPFRCVYPHGSNKVQRYPIPDREAGALRRVRGLCQQFGLYFYHQTDPRGAALYVSNQPLTSQDYNAGVCCSV